MQNVIKVTNLHKIFKLNLKKTHVLKWVNLEVKKWEVFWFLWPNGAGKTTTMKAILDFIKPSKWDILLFGEKLPENRKILKKIWYAPEQAYYYDHLKWEEFLYLMWKLSWLDKNQLEEKVPFFLNKVWLAFAGDRFIKDYSKWMKQRLGIASAIIHEPEFVFFDEPTSWLDPLWRNLIKNIILELKQKKVTVFFNTHILSDVQEIADKFAIINKWEIIYEDQITNTKESLEELFVKIVKHHSGNKVFIK